MATWRKGSIEFGPPADATKNHVGTRGIHHETHEAHENKPAFQMTLTTRPLTAGQAEVWFFAS